MLKIKSLRSISASALSTALQLSLLFFVNHVSAATFYSGPTGEVTNIEHVMEHVQAGQVLIISETHDSAIHHDNQREIMKELVRSGFRFSVGMEFFDYTQQDIVDEFFYGRMSEEEFLNRIGWSEKLPFEYYDFVVRFPRYIGGKTKAINLPRAITGKVSKSGLDSLSDEEKALLPPHFAMGTDSYFERFAEVMKGHVSEEQILRYFTSQSLWDDTMAWKAASYLKGHPDQVFVIIVGDFHVAYQDGLVARLRARGVDNVLSISQVDSLGLSESEKSAMIKPHSRYGVRADFVLDAQ